jgi:hypothetical protein
MKKRRQTVVTDLVEYPPLGFLTSSLQTLDTALRGGLPVPGIVEVFGPPAAGKSLFAMLFKPDLYIDAERSMESSWLTRWSPKSRLLREQAWEVVKEAVMVEAQKGSRLVIVDSLPALRFDDQRPGALARAVGDWCWDIMPYLQETCLMLLNQVRMEFNVHYPMLTSPGGFNIKHACKLRVKLTRGQYHNERIQETKVQVVKCKYGLPEGQASIFFALDETGAYQTVEEAKR